MALFIHRGYEGVMHYSKPFQRAALLEGTTLLFLLIVALPLKYIYHYPIAVQLTGPVHGICFLWYQYLALELITLEGVGVRRGFLLLTAAFLPGGTFLALRTGAGS